MSIWMAGTLRGCFFNMQEGWRETKGRVFVNQSAVFCLHALIDEVVYQSNKGNEMPKVPSGWATREKCVRGSSRFPPDVVEQLEYWFTFHTRLNNDQIATRLKEKFKWGRKCLRVQQISGWVSTFTTKQSTKKKKAIVMAAAEEAHDENEVAGAADDELTEQQLEDQDEGKENEVEVSETDGGELATHEDLTDSDQNEEDSECSEEEEHEDQPPQKMQRVQDDMLCCVDIEIISETSIVAAVAALEAKKKQWKHTGRLLCGKMVSVDSYGEINWLGNTEASTQFMRQTVLGPESSEDEDGKVVEMEGSVKQVVFGCKSTNVAVCYVEYETTGTHKLLAVESVLEAMKKYKAMQRAMRTSNKAR